MQLAAIDLNHPAHYISVGPFAISIGNLIVILSMMAIFTIALFLPFPHLHNSKKSNT